MGVDTLATDPVEPNRLYVQGGTYTNEWTNQNGAIYRSTDRGNTFERTDLPFKGGGNMPGRQWANAWQSIPIRTARSILAPGAVTDFGGAPITAPVGRRSKTFPTPAHTSRVPTVPPAGHSGGGVGDLRSTNRDPGNPTQDHLRRRRGQGRERLSQRRRRRYLGGRPRPTDRFLPHHGVLASTACSTSVTAMAAVHLTARRATLEVRHGDRRVDEDQPRAVQQR